MPELPEVETVRRDLEEDVLGKRIAKVKVIDKKVVKEPSVASFEKGLRGARLSGFFRRAKVLAIGLSTGEYLVVHLRMTGQLVHSRAPADKARVWFGLSDGSFLSFNDQRRFGELRLVRDWKELAFVRSLGIEPLDKNFNAHRFKDMLSQKKTKIKPLLMDQSFIAGLGNLYAQEALFHARILPDRVASSLKGKEILKLNKAIKKVLREGIRYRGSSVDNYVTGRGSRGAYQLRLKVYDRKGEKCARCSSPIKKVSLAGRGTCFCPQCQK